MWKTSTIGIITLFFLSLLFSFVTSSSVSAVSDYQGYFDSTVTFPFIICYSQDDPNNVPQCGDYDTIKIIPDVVPTPLNTARYYQILNMGNSANYYVTAFISSTLDISSISTELRIVNQYSFGSGSFNYVLTNSSEPECPICPVVPDNPYDEKFDQVTRAIYVCAAVLLVLYFFYCIYRLIIRNTGGF